MSMELKDGMLLLGRGIEGFLEGMTFVQAGEVGSTFSKQGKGGSRKKNGAGHGALVLQKVAAVPGGCLTPP